MPGAVDQAGGGDEQSRVGSGAADREELYAGFAGPATDADAFAGDRYRRGVDS